jgi:hypothetical protein
MLEENHRTRGSLRRSFQLNEWEVPAPRQVSNVPFDPLTAATSNLRLRAGRRRDPWPMSSRFKPWLQANRPSVEVDLVRRRTIESLLRPVSVVPVLKQRQPPVQGVALVGDQQSPRALALQRSREAFDHSDAAVLANHPFWRKVGKAGKLGRR